jgi:enoyl-CoA hydratase/carnithine racemase
MIDGSCIGGGLQIAMSADIRLASEGSTFGIPAARIGIGYRDVDRLVALVGPGRAAELVYTAARITAQEALTAGLVNRVLPSADLEAATQGLAHVIAANAPLTIRAAKAAIRLAVTGGTDADRAIVDRLAEECFASEDFAEGMSAARDRRTARFQGR